MRLPHESHGYCRHHCSMPHRSRSHSSMSLPQSSDTSRIARTGFRLLDAHSLRPSQKSSPHSSFRFLLSHRKDKHVRSALPLSDSSMSVRYDPAPLHPQIHPGETFCTMLYMTYFSLLIFLLVFHSSIFRKTIYSSLLYFL